MNKIINEEDITISRITGNDKIDGTNVISSHYVNANFKEILNRRIERFVTQLKSNDNILFIRDDALDTICEEELIEFKYLIEKINPNISYKILLCTKNITDKPINVDKVYHREYNFSNYTTYVSECFALDTCPQVNNDLH
jgi:hypothetical protein